MFALNRRAVVAAYLAALGPVWVVLYATMLALPAPDPITHAIAPVVPFLRAASIGFSIVWAVPGLVLLSMGLWGLLRSASHEVPLERRRTRQFLQVGAFAWFAMLLSAPLWHIRYAAAEACAKRSQPVVEALREYRKAVGRYPDSLKDLTAPFLRKEAAPGLLAYPTYEYLRAGANPASGGYELIVSMPHGGSADMLVYWPSETYPDKLPPGNVVRVHRWAYVRD